MVVTRYESSCGITKTRTRCQSVYLVTREYAEVLSGKRKRRNKMNTLYILLWWIIECNNWSLFIQHITWDAELSEIYLIDSTKEPILILESEELGILSHDCLSLALYLDKRSESRPLIDHELYLISYPPDLMVGLLVCLLPQSHSGVYISHRVKI